MTGDIIPVEQADIPEEGLKNRGYVTNRYLSNNLPPTGDLCDERIKRSGLSVGIKESVLDRLCLTEADLRGKCVLDVGTGGGRAYEQAMQNAVTFGWDYYAIDLAHIVTEKGFRDSRSALREQVAIDNLTRVIKQYPDHFRTADATRRIPFPDRSFDLVFSCIALPSYARNEQEAIRSIFEMIRVSRGKVVFNFRYDESNPNAPVPAGVGRTSFTWVGKKLFDALTEARVMYEIRHSDQPDVEYAERTFSAHLDVSNVDIEALMRKKTLFVSETQSNKVFIN